jgi:Domain of unknown function (DUF6265)
MNRFEPRTLATAAMLATLVSGTAAIERQHTLDMAGFIAGCWANERAEAGSGEVWLAPAGGVMLGLSRTLRAGRATAHEFMQIRLDDEGRLVFVAHPSGQKQTSFALASHGPQTLSFENPAHDFPTRIVYRAAGSERLEARIEGLRGGVLRGIDFGFRRVPCEPAPLTATPAR